MLAMDDENICQCKNKYCYLDIPLEVMPKNQKLFQCGHFGR